MIFDHKKTEKFLTVNLCRFTEKINKYVKTKKRRLFDAIESLYTVILCEKTISWTN